MMSGDYQVGDLSNLLQPKGKAGKSGNDTDEKLQSLFSSKPQVSAKVQSGTNAAKVKKRKQKIMNEDNATSHGEDDSPKKKKRKDKSDINTPIETIPESSSPQKKGKSGKIQKKKTFDEQSDVPQISHSPGFNPPAGIVHESLMNSGKKNKKRKVVLSSDSEDEDENKIPLKKKSQYGDTSNKKKGTRPRRDKMAKESDHKTVFIGNLPLTVKKKKLMNLMKDYGAIESIRYRCFAPNDPNMKKRVVAIKQNLHPDRHNCVAYVKFMTPEAARKALACNGKKLDGLHLRVDMAARDQVRDIKKSVFVGNLPFDMEEDSVRSHFADCGTIDNIRIVRDSKTSLGKGFCYINFNDTDAVAFALRLNGSKIAGRELRVMQCLPNPKKSVLERKKDKSGKASKTSKQHSKKETKPQHIETEPFTVIDAGKLDAGKLSETVDQDNNDDEETPRKMSFAEKFEKKKQKRFEKVKAGKKDKNLSETENAKGEKKEKSGLESGKVKNKDKASFKKQKKQKLKKADSRTGSDRSKIFAKSPKKTGPNPPQRTKTFDGKPSSFRSNKPNVFKGNKNEAFAPNKHSKPEQSNKHIKFDKSEKTSSNKHTKFDRAANKHIKFDKSEQSSAHKQNKFNNFGNSGHRRTSTKPSEGIANTSISKATSKHIYFD